MKNILLVLLLTLLFSACSQINNDNDKVDSINDEENIIESVETIVLSNDEYLEIAKENVTSKEPIKVIGAEISGSSKNDVLTKLFNGSISTLGADLFVKTKEEKKDIINEEKIFIPFNIKNSPNEPTIALNEMIQLEAENCSFDASKQELICYYEVTNYLDFTSNEFTSIRAKYVFEFSEENSFKGFWYHFVSYVSTENVKEELVDEAIQLKDLSSEVIYANRDTNDLNLISRDLLSSIGEVYTSNFNNYSSIYVRSVID